MATRPPPTLRSNAIFMLSPLGHTTILLFRPFLTQFPLLCQWLSVGVSLLCVTFAVYLLVQAPPGRQTFLFSMQLHVLILTLVTDFNLAYPILDQYYTESSLYLALAIAGFFILSFITFLIVPLMSVIDDQYEFGDIPTQRLFAATCGFLATICGLLAAASASLGSSAVGTVTTLRVYANTLVMDARDIPVRTRHS